MTNSIYVPVDASLVDVVLPFDSGYPEEKAKADTPEAVRASMGSALTDIPQSWYVRPQDLKERAAENDRLGLWAENRWDRFTNQQPTHECVFHAAVAVLEAAINRQRALSFEPLVVQQRQQMSVKAGTVWLAVNSGYAEANPGQWGGSSLQDAIAIIFGRGFLPDMIQPRDYKFRHFMWGTAGEGGINQSTGPWPGWSRDTFKKHPDGWADENWRETSKWFRGIEGVTADDEEQYDSVLINGGAWGIARSGHSVPVGRIVWDQSGRKRYRYKDSYNRFLYDSRPYLGSCYSVLTAAQPDDYNYPAGK